MKIYEGKFPPEGTGKVAIVVAKYNKTITDRLLDGALAKLKEGGIRDDDITVVWVPGAFEIPTLAQRFALDEDYQAVICLGCVIKGETTHDEHINRAVSLELARIGVEAGIPVIFGVLTCGTAEQAMARSTVEEPSNDKTAGERLGNKGTEAAEAALEMLDILLQLPELADEEGASEESLIRNAKRYRAGDFDDDLFSDGEEDFDEAEGDFSENGFRKDFGGPRHKSDKRPKERNGGAPGGKKPFKGGRHDFKDSWKKGPGKNKSDRPKKRK